MPSAPLPEAVEIITHAESPINLVLLFVEQRSDLDASLPELVPVLDGKTLFWIAYRKGGREGRNRFESRPAL